MPTRTLANLIWPDGQTNPSGILSKVYYFRKADIKAWPKMKTDPTSASEAVTYEGDFEFLEGKTAISIYSTQGTGKAGFDPVGDKDHKMYNNTLALSYPDMNDEGIDFANANVNSNGIFIVPYFVAGGEVKYAVIGGQHFDPVVDVKGTTGDQAGSAKGLNIEVTVPDAYALPRYTGILPLPDGTINCGTGVFTPAGGTPEPDPAPGA